MNTSWRLYVDRIIIKHYNTENQFSIDFFCLVLTSTSNQEGLVSAVRKNQQISKPNLLPISTELSESLNSMMFTTDWNQNFTTWIYFWSCDFLTKFTILVGTIGQSRGWAIWEFSPSLLFLTVMITPKWQDSVHALLHEMRFPWLSIERSSFHTFVEYVKRI